MRHIWLLLPLCACGAAEEKPVVQDLVAFEHPEFTVRGRWLDASALRVRIDSKASPLPEAVYESAVRDALASWSFEGHVGFEVVDSTAPCDVIYAWRTGAHDACSPFGHDARVAHTGPFPEGKEPMFVHFDANADWSQDGALERAALHETGHVLGLGHSSDPAALMHSEIDARRDRLRASDRAGLASLYGTPFDGSALVLDDGTPILCGVTPAGITEFGVFDTDADGDSEVLVWRTDRAGHGTLWIYHFAPGPRLARSVGPLIGQVVPGAEIRFRLTDAEEALFLMRMPDQAPVVRVFRDGIPQPRSPNAPPVLGEWPALDRSGDLDGDGSVDVVRAAE